MVVEEEEVMGDKGEDGWLLMLALVADIDRSTDGPGAEGPLPTAAHPGYARAWLQHRLS